MGKYEGTTAHKFIQLPNGTLGIYNDWDTWTTGMLIGPLVQELQEHGQWDYYLSDIEPLQYAAIDMTVRGIQVDQAAKTAYRRKVRRELMGVDNFICRVADQAGFKYTDKFPNSKPQAAQLLYKHLKLQVRKTTPKGGWSVDQDALTRILRNLRKRDEPYTDLIHGFFHRSRLATIDSRYLNFNVDTDGRVRPVVKMLATKTLRYAYENPPLQQYPKEARHIFVAAPGKVFVSADYAQLEARILACLSGDSVSIQVFEEGGDVHAQNTRDLFGWDDDRWAGMDDVRREKSRYYAKSFLYRLSYGGSAAAGDKKLVCPCVKWGCAAKNPPVVDLKRSEAVASEKRWFAKHQAVLDFQRDTATEIKRTHFYNPPLGGRRWIAEPWGAELDREAKNIPIQTTAAQVMNRAQIRLYKADLPIVLQWHDQLVAEVQEDMAPVAAQSMRAIMECSVPELGGVSFPVDITIGKNLGGWSKENLDGLKEI